ncbi:MAG: F0F1 ATP synthase subunit alpha [Candidatus Campbellbacteria bacterium]|nr:F0F1 ATP synthase subunit alpha [Candidatus Campbellbacteria bacterium]
MKIDTLIKELNQRIDKAEIDSDVEEVGTVAEVHDGIARISGLSAVESSEMLLFPGGVMGLALNLEEDAVGSIIIGDASGIKEGDTVKRTKNILSIPVGEKMIGRVINPLGDPLDGKGDIESRDNYLLEKKAPGVMEREPVSEPVQTGIKAIDAMIPVGRGQRELIIGDRQTGKTTVAVDTILNQKGKDLICIYVAVNQKQSKVARVVKTLEENGALEYTTVVLAGASDGPALSYLAPYAGASLGEYFMDQGKDVLVVFDDLSKHAASYREISLLLRRPPGREAYPGDVFYIHSRLLERAAKRDKEHGGGSMTALPIIETQAGDISSYIPTNVISITDGQIFLETGLFYRGVRPAINIGNSVSRVGGSAQIKSMKKVSGRMKLDLAQYRELESFSQFASDLDQETKQSLDRGQRIVELLKQPANRPVPVGIQIALVYAVNSGFLDEVPIQEISKWEKDLWLYLESSHADLLDKLVDGWDDETEESLKQALYKFEKTRT